MTYSILDPLEKQAVDALSSQQYVTAISLFYNLSKKGEDGCGRDLTHVCVAAWMGVQRYCDSAGQLYIGAKTGWRDAGYTSELFVACLFKLRNTSSKMTSPLSELICETVIKIESILEHLTTQMHSIYALPWHANVLRGMGNYDECAKLIKNALSNPLLPESETNQLCSCRNRILSYDKDCSIAYEYVKITYPKIQTLDENSIGEILNAIKIIWSDICNSDQSDMSPAKNFKDGSDFICSDPVSERLQKVWWQFWK